MTARQLSLITGISLDGCSHVLKKLARAGLVVCCNPEARRSRIYWLTSEGISLHNQISPTAQIMSDYSNYDLSLFGWLCFSHRAVVVKALTHPMQPTAIKRKIRLTCPTACISANNVRDIIRRFLEKGIVRKIHVRKRAHPCYELTETGKQFQKLLVQVPT